MRVFLLLLLFAGNMVWACGDKPLKQKAFAKHYRTASGFATYQVYLPIDNDDNVLSGSYATIPSLFWFSLELQGDDEYLGDYRMAIVSVNPDLIDKLTLHVDYSPKPTKDGGLTFCLDRKTYQLSELLEVPEPKKRPESDLSLFRPPEPVNEKGE